MNQYGACIKRWIDIVASLGGLLLLWPLFALVALLVASTSRGGVFFRQVRIGRFGKPFSLLKFRTMQVMGARSSAVTVAGDPRITRIGRLLRRFKLDEFPQLINVLKGEMSLVGPRPDVPGYADRLTGEEAAILTVRPGITGPASIFFRDEELLLAGVPDAQRFNDTVIWPKKVAINKKYVAEWSLFKDVAYILVTVCPALDMIFRVLKGIPPPEPGPEWRRHGGKEIGDSSCSRPMDSEALDKSRQ
jgi:lipopolysaccharide/colanic/teichoic acid biosynthesis glycosyltransferase